MTKDSLKSNSENLLDQQNKIDKVLNSIQTDRNLPKPYHPILPLQSPIHDHAHGYINSHPAKNHNNRTDPNAHNLAEPRINDLRFVAQEQRQEIIQTVHHHGIHQVSIH